MNRSLPSSRSGRGILIAALLALSAMRPEPGSAEEPEPPPPSVLERIERLERALADDPGMRPETKQALLEALRALRAERIAGAATPPAASAPPAERSAWEKVLEKLAPYGDLRLRHESSFDHDSRPDRHRQRLRLRFGANYQVLEEVLVGARLTTGSRDDPASPHVTLGNGFDKLEVTLDRIFGSYRPAWLEGAVLTAGKFAHPFYQNPVYGELVWDADVQPEGAYVGYSRSKLGWIENLEVIAGEYILLEQGDADEAVSTAVQVKGQVRPAERFALTLAVGYTYYTDATPDDSRALLLENAGNAAIDEDGDGIADDFRSRFAILNPVLAVAGEVWEVPVVAAGEYILNTEARGGAGQGWAVGLAAGGARRRGDWRAYYQWQIVEQDAVFSTFAQDDFLLRTNHRSHVFGVNYQILEKLGIHLWGLVSARDRTSSSRTADGDNDQWRVRLDINLRL